MIARFTVVLRLLLQVPLVAFIVLLLSRMWARYQLIIIAAIGWSFGGVLTKSIRYEMCSMTSARSQPYAVVFLLYIAWTVSRQSRNGSCPPNWHQSIRQACGHVFLTRDKEHWICALCAATNMTLLTWGFIISPGGMVTFLHSGAMFFVLLASARFLGHVPSKMEFAVVGVGLFGMGLLAADGLWSGNWLSALLGFACACTMAIGLIAQKRRGKHWVRGTEGLESWVLSSTILSVLFFPAICWSGPPDLKNLGLILVLSLITTGLPDLLWVRAMHGPSGAHLLHAMIISRISPILTPIWIWRILGEQPSALAVLGAVVVIVSVCWLIIVQELHKKNDSDPNKSKEERPVNQRLLGDAFVEPSEKLDPHGFNPDTVDPDMIDPDVLSEFIQQENDRRAAACPSGFRAVSAKELSGLLSLALSQDDHGGEHVRV